VKYLLKLDKLSVSDVVNSKDSNNWTPLHLAAYYNHLEPIKILIQHGADIESLDGHGQTPLYAAATKVGSEDAVKLLIDHRARSKELKNNSGQWLFEAAATINPEYLPADRSFIFPAAYIGNCALLQRYKDTLDRMAVDPNSKVKDSIEEIFAPNSDGRTVLHEAARGGDSKVTAMMLHWLKSERNKITLNMSDKRGGWTALHLAAFYGNVDVLLQLIEAGADTNIKDRMFNNTALMTAISADREETAKLLLKLTDLTTTNVSAVNAQQMASSHNMGHLFGTKV